MFKQSKELSLVRGAVFGNGSVHITHLQFADDMVLLLEPNMEYLFNAKRILRCFELVSGLRINFHKSCLVRVGKKQPGEGNWAIAFRCVLKSLPLNYVGLPLGGNANRETFWKHVVSRVEQRLSPWKGAIISKGGRLVLIKANLYSLPSYFMSVFSIPVVVAKKLEKLRCVFFWNDNHMRRNIHYVDWDTLCKHKKHGGLGIGKMRDKGLSLIAK
ncbi:hypothetical protein Ddye_001641 [Dipteronia dyeriana]|uniref:Reverse transcriptase domain-containing protein n=1 Tax=Dipteronia dyeriana TaxID=168575 RepID=A0AAD9XPF1_9ROSI|nr:hypothetical protein Ddye_001641 [Dipteronia dyeriana]